MPMVKKQVEIPVTLSRPQDHIFWAYLQGDTTEEEAIELLVTRYRYGREGAKNALHYVKENPQVVKKPKRYDSIYDNEQSL